MSVVLGIAAAIIAGFAMGSGSWAVKTIRGYRLEHLLLVGTPLSLVIIPLTLTLLLCPSAIDGYRSIDADVYIKSNLFSLGWGMASILCNLCVVRVGAALTGGIVSGLAISLGTMIPMIFTASGLFEKAPSITSAAGHVIVLGVTGMLVGVVFISRAGFGRDRELEKLGKKQAGFLGGLIMAVVAGLLSGGPNFAFACSQKAIRDAMTARGAAELPATFAVWPVGLTGGLLVILSYSIYTITRNRSWNVLKKNPREFLIPIAGAIQFSAAILLFGAGNRVLGALGPSVGWGTYVGASILGGQMIGFLWGEWSGIHGSPRCYLYTGIIALIAASAVLAYASYLV